MIAHPSTLGNNTRDEFFKTPVIANEYIPFYAFQTLEDGYYNKPSLESGWIRKPNTVKHIKDALQMAMAPRRITISNRVYFFAKGVMFTDTGTPMIVFAMPREKFLNPDTKKFSEIRYQKEVNPVDYKDFVLFYSTSFFTDPTLAALNRRFQKEILMDCYSKGIEVRVITSQEIERNTFADLFEIPKANSVSQLEEYMSKVLPTYLFTEEEDTFAFDELGTVQAQEELTLEEEALLFDSEPATTTSYNPPDWNGEYQVEREEMEREATTWEDSAHTESSIFVSADPASNDSRNVILHTDIRGFNAFNEALRAEANSQLSGYSAVTNSDPQATRSFVERLRPLEIDYAMANALTAISAHVTQVEDVTWRSRRVGSRDSRPIELIDDEV